MPPVTFKRRVLSALEKDELLDIGRGLGLDVTTRMSVNDLRDALAGSKRAGVAAIIQELVVPWRGERVSP